MPTQETQITEKEVGNMSGRTIFSGCINETKHTNLIKMLMIKDIYNVTVYAIARMQLKVDCCMYLLVPT